MLVPLLLTLAQDAAPAKEAAPFGPMEVGIAADVLGLHFSEKELELMLPDVLERLKEFEKLRAVPLANEVAPALYFLPAPEQLRQPGVEWRPPILGGPPPKRPDNLEELAYMPIWELHMLLVHHVVSCEELTRVCLARLKRLDPQLHCVVTLTEERALAQARERDAEFAAGKGMRGMLHGLPWVAKDLLAVKGYPTTWGTPPLKEQRLDYDAAVVERLDAAGAILIAKVSLGELAMGDVWFGGKTRNPWKPEQGSSGSSAGTASAVSAGCAVFGIGSETLGSIVSPSTVCGNSSLRPTFGQVSRYGAMTLCWSMDKLGPLCHSAEDAALVFTAIHGRDPRDPTTVDMAFDPSFGPGPARDLKGWKIGVPKGAFDGEKRDQSVLEELKKLGAELVDVELPKYPVEEMLVVLNAEAGAAFDDFSRGDKDDQMVRQDRNSWPNSFRHAELIPAVDYIRANRLRTLLIRDWEAVLGGVKVIVYPSFSGSLLAATNLTGHPTFVAPCGFAEDGTPYSISFTGKLFGDADVLAVGRAWQGSTDYHLRHPKL